MMRERVLFLVVAVVTYCAPASVASECDPDPCQNGGTCMDLGVGYICACPVEYQGLTCESLANPCQPSPCQNGALCFRRSGLEGVPYRCICSGPFTGPNCDLPTTPCSPDPCLNGGECHVIDDNYQCQCTGGFQGINCETFVSTALTAVDSEVSPCEISPCKNGGLCLVSERDPSQYICRCVADFGGRNCEKMPCEMNPCTHGGDCFSSFLVDGTYMCRCPRGYKGKNCEISDACSGNPCGEGNLCLDGEDGGFSCLCPCAPGSTCNSSPDSTDESDVSGGDNTASDGNSGTVNGGDNDVDTTPRETVDGDGVTIFRCVRMMKATFNCSEHGDCLIRDSTAICRCHDGFMGVACQDPTPDSSSGIDSRPISSGGSGSTGGSGVVTDDSSSYRCVRMMDSTHECMGHGYCVIDQETAVCRCDPGYMGVACQDETGETVNNSDGDSDSGSTGGSVSGSNGTPDTQQSSYQCTRMMLASSNCMGHGFCSMSLNTAICRCYDGFKGVICEVETGSVGSGVSNSGTVSGDSSSGTVSGDSSSGTVGGVANSVSGSVALANDVNCDRMMTATDNCNGRGQCVVSHDTAICYCNQGYMGVVCQEEI